MKKNNTRINENSSDVYISPIELTRRWACSRATADRIARRAGLTRVCLGEGLHGIVRYPISEVEAFEETRKARAAYD